MAGLMVDSQLPLQVKPWQFDVGSALQQAGQIRGTELANQGRITSNALSGLQLQETQDEVNALRGFRQAQAAGDPAAQDQLAGYPELQLKMRTALDGMKQADQDEVIARGLMMAHAAQTVAALPADAPE